MKRPPAANAAVMLLLALCAVPAARADDAITAPVRLVSSADPESPGGKAAALALKLMMERAGLRYTLSQEPTERAVISLRTGFYDADLLRYAQFDRFVPGALRVDPHLISTHVMAFSRTPLPPTGWDSLRGLRVAYVRGIKLIEQELGGKPGTEATTAAPSCLGMAAADRVDVCLLNVETSPASAEPMGGTRLHRSVLVNVNLHVWVAPGKDALARRLTGALRDAVASGELQRALGDARQP